MGASWYKYIQPILNSWQGDHFSWVWDPFLEKYPQFDAKQQMEVDNALVESAFDPINHDIAIKALSIVENLYFSGMSSTRLISLISDRLRNHIGSLKLDDETSQYYVFAFSNFGIKEAIPLIKSVVVELEKKREESIIDDVQDRSNNYSSMLWACCIALSRLDPKEATPFLPLMLDYDRRMGILAKPGAFGLTYRALANQWEHIGINGLRAILQGGREWSETERMQVYGLAVNALQHKASQNDQYEGQKLAREILRVP